MEFQLPEKVRQEVCKFKSCLGYTMNSRKVQVLSNTKYQKKKKVGLRLQPSSRALV